MTASTSYRSAMSTIAGARVARLAISLVAFGAFALPAAAQARVSVPPRPITTGKAQLTPTLTQAEITNFANSIEASVDNSPFAKQVAGPAAPLFETSAPNATGMTNVTLRWTALPSTGTPRMGFVNLMGYVVLRATSRPGVWDSVAFVTAPPAHVQAQVSPEANAIFRVGAYYNLTRVSIADGGINATETHTVAGNPGNWIADTTHAVRVISH